MKLLEQQMCVVALSALLHTSVQEEHNIVVADWSKCYGVIWFSKQNNTIAIILKFDHV